MTVLPGVLGPRTLRRTVQVRLRSESLRFPGGKAIFTVSRHRFVKYAGSLLHARSAGSTAWCRITGNGVPININHFTGEKPMKHKSVCLCLITAVLLLVVGCASNQAAVQDQPDLMNLMTTAPKKPPQYFIQPDDQLDIKFFYNPELNETVKVRPDGKISLQLVDEVHAAGLSPSQLDNVLTRQYARELKNPEIAVIVKSFAGQRVYVGGEVNRQGLIELTGGMTALQAVINAGGFKETAKPDAAILIRKGPNNEPLPMRIDLDNVVYEEGIVADIQLQPYDIVYVPKTWIANANKWVDQYISQLLLFRGWSFGFTYELRDKVDINF